MDFKLTKLIVLKFEKTNNKKLTSEMRSDFFIFISLFGFVIHKGVFYK